MRLTRDLNPLRKWVESGTLEGVWTMKRSRFTEEQIIGILGEHEPGVKTAGLCDKHGVSPPSEFRI